MDPLSKVGTLARAARELEALRLAVNRPPLGELTDDLALSRLLKAREEFPAILGPRSTPPRTCRKRQAKIAFLLKSLLPHGEALTECAVDTTEGTIVADDVWASPERFRIIADEISCSIAPEICVDVWSPSNTPEEIAQKCRLYLDKGALEFWYCDEQGRMSFFSQSGALPKSRFCPGFPDNVTVA
ncbi:MAG: Uma2 family endonuclease [Verrucomicrobia bacterium]|nr:Uma2 family endonuclease [Verrucomicrobiota bacterium]